MPLAVCVSMRSQYAFCADSGNKGRKASFQNEGPGLEHVLLLMMLVFSLLLNGLRSSLQFEQEEKYIIIPCGAALLTHVAQILLRR